MKKILLFTLLLVALQIETNAQIFPILCAQRVGISTAEFLKIGVGSRASAMGDAFVAVANDASALYWNPAGLVQFKDDQLLISHNMWVVDINHDFVGAVYHMDETNAFGIAFTALSMQDMPVTTEFQPFGTGNYFGFGDMALADRKSTRLNSSHLGISYAVFCL